ncbi:MAG: hypothetical protein CNF01_08135 [Halieaceae bacterium MED-G27]|nr:hypothetical protein [Halieaceae bacterium]OUT67580.1 MAG: hypothetical protein CBB81_00840 [Cellvibrionales bacterium TMED21]PDH35637.1 MAG: hypothetical protein CNF01_08135 [Halieaceae bacterium MED-G27]
MLGKNRASPEIKPLKETRFSRCHRYRYYLSHRWSDGERCVFIGLNPSTATSKQDDATVRKCAAFASKWGYSGFELINLFAFRSRDPNGLTRHPEPIGPSNNRWISRTLSDDKLVVACWGNGGALLQRDEIIKAMQDRLYCLGVTKSGQPKHPLYLPTSTQLTAL